MGAKDRRVVQVNERLRGLAASGCRVWDGLGEDYRLQAKQGARHAVSEAHTRYAWLTDKCLLRREGNDM